MHDIPTGGSAPPRPLAALLAQAQGARLLAGDPAVAISGVAFDSRRVRSGNLFVAIPGFKRDAREFVGQAVSNGAVAIVCEDPVPEAPAARIVVPNARAALADFAAAFYGQPSRSLTLIGVTGTDGKTSTTQLTSAVLETAGLKTGWLSTVDLKIGSERRPNDLNHTTPEAVGVQALIREWVDANVEVGVLEVSSHALALDRVRGCDFDLGIFTNISSEHLNFHGSFAEYLAAKSKLFQMLGVESERRRPRYGVVNLDDASSPAILAACRAPVIGYSIETPAEVRAEDIELRLSGARFRLLTPAGSAVVQTRLLGRFNVYNWLAAAAAAHALGIGPDRVAEAAATLPAVKGRMELVEHGQPFAVIVDFAHTPQALETALRTARQHTSGRLTLVFGNAGERDPASRPEMGRLAAELSDYFIISMDDPLDEDPEVIAQEAADGAQRAGATRGADFEIELDRRRAIQLLIRRAQPGDTILLAGKGHEARMLVGAERLPWNDREAAEQLLDARHDGR